MKAYLIPLTLLLISLDTSLAFQDATRTDQEQLRYVFSEYIAGWRMGDTERLRNVFDDSGYILWVSGNTDDETLNAMTFGKALERRKPQPSYGTEWEILDLDIIDGELAHGKLYISRENGSYIDVLVCQKINGTWKIVTKTFVVR